MKKYGISLPNQRLSRIEMLTKRDYIVEYVGHLGDERRNHSQAKMKQT
jgi:hypothetical protein